MITGIFISAFPPHFSMVTVTVSTGYSKYVNIKGKNKKTVQQSGVQKYNMKAKCLQFSHILLFCTLIMEEHKADLCEGLGEKHVQVKLKAYQTISSTQSKF